MTIGKAGGSRWGALRGLHTAHRTEKGLVPSESSAFSPIQRTAEGRREKAEDLRVLEESVTRGEALSRSDD